MYHVIFGQPLKEAIASVKHEDALHVAASLFGRFRYDNITNNLQSMTMTRFNIYIYIYMYIDDIGNKQNIAVCSL